MPRRAIGSLALISFVVLLVQGDQPGVAQGKQSVCVVAVRDGSLFTLCPPPGVEPTVAKRLTVRPERERMITRSPEGLYTIFIPPPFAPNYIELHFIPASMSFSPDRRMLEYDWRQFAGSTPELGQSGWIDETLKAQIVKELRKEKKIQIVEAPEQADIIFLAEGIYAPLTVYRRYQGNNTNNYYSFWGDSGGKDANFLEAILALAVPGEVYRKNPGDAAALLKEPLWSGWVAWQQLKSTQQFVPATPEALVKQFLKGKSMDDWLPFVCASWFPPSRSVAVPPEGSAVAAKARDGVSATTTGDKAIRVDVALVTVPVVATDRSGKTLADLKPGDFHLFEDDVEQTIDRVIAGSEPINVTLMMDTSGSTRFKIEEIQNAALTFLCALAPEDRLMVVSFNRRIYLDSELASDRMQLQRAILQTRTSGGTRLFDALHMVMGESLDRLPGRKAILLFTDGVDTESRFMNAAAALSRIEQSNVAVHVIRYDTQVQTKPVPREYRRVLGKTEEDATAYDEANRFLQSLSSGSGGRLFHAETIPSLNEAFREIAQELRRQYTLYYYPADPKNDGAYHQIRVAVDREDVTIRARSGYRRIAVR
ncbi:MAG: VWA domain-containing protein [Acidobacteriia bacterium]|nr:VWA domain-containing protein [Terriglobia bacterium]